MELAASANEKTVAVLRQQLLSAAPEELKAIQRRVAPAVWAIETARIQLPTKKFSFEGREFMLPVYRDLAPEIVVIKGAQMGFSTMSILRALWSVTTLPMSVIYSFPTKSDVSPLSPDFV